MVGKTQQGIENIAELSSGEKSQLPFSPRELATICLFLSPGRVTEETIRGEIIRGMGIVYIPPAQANSKQSSQPYT